MYTIKKKKVWYLMYTGKETFKKGMTALKGLKIDASRQTEVRAADPRREHVQKCNRKEIGWLM
ncbi:hypothetical protein ACFSQT_35720 [Mesorhizobium calcicola]|uniref:Uncharacterized protein n=1 Tax=Mesorhizobium calcicola TaxID=1300310 RepID=A0ABW4WQ75_9HYPH